MLSAVANQSSHRFLVFCIIGFRCDLFVELSRYCHYFPYDEIFLIWLGFAPKWAQMYTKINAICWCQPIFSHVKIFSFCIIGFRCDLNVKLSRYCHYCPYEEIFLIWLGYAPKLAQMYTKINAICWCQPIFSQIFSFLYNWLKM